jgi:hypothetical protein
MYVSQAWSLQLIQHRLGIQPLDTSQSRLTMQVKEKHRVICWVWLANIIFMLRKKKGYWSFKEC